MRADLYQTLIDLQEYLDGYVDVLDGDEESGPRPNRAMQLHEQVTWLIEDLEHGRLKVEESVSKRTHTP